LTIVFPLLIIRLLGRKKNEKSPLLFFRADINRYKLNSSRDKSVII